MSKIREETTYDISDFKFIQGFAKVTNIFIGYYTISPVYINFDVTPMILYVCDHMMEVVYFIIWIMVLE